MKGRTTPDPRIAHIEELVDHLVRTTDIDKCEQLATRICELLIGFSRGESVMTLAIVLATIAKMAPPGEAPQVIAACSVAAADMVKGYKYVRQR